MSVEPSSLCCGHQQCQLRQLSRPNFLSGRHGTLETYQRRILQGKYLPGDK